MKHMTLTDLLRFLRTLLVQVLSCILVTFRSKGLSMTLIVTRTSQKVIYKNLWETYGEAKCDSRGYGYSVSWESSLRISVSSRLFVYLCRF